MLRAQLDSIIANNDLADQWARIDELRREHPHTIQVVKSKEPLDSYTCLVHALGFTAKPEYRAIALYRPWTLAVFAGRDFAHWLLNSEVLAQVPSTTAAAGDLVTYFSGGDRFEHVGLATSPTRVESKWGTGGLYEHATLEVPESYGSHVRWYRKLPYAEARRLFFQYAKEKGVPLEQVLDSE